MTKKTPKKYALMDYYKDKSGDLVIESDDYEEIKKSVEQYLKDTNGECLLIVSQRGKDGQLHKKT